MTWNDGDHIDVEWDGLVSHVVGSSHQRGNWKQYWMSHTGRKWPERCKIQGCGNYAEVGAHIWLKMPSRNILKTGFIIPTCQTCNKDGIHDFPNWVSVNQGTLAVCKEAHDNMYE